MLGARVTVGGVRRIAVIGCARPSVACGVQLTDPRYSRLVPGSPVKKDCLCQSGFRVARVRRTPVRATISGLVQGLRGDVARVEHAVPNARAGPGLGKLRGAVVEHRPTDGHGPPETGEESYRQICGAWATTLAVAGTNRGARGWRVAHTIVRGPASGLRCGSPWDRRALVRPLAPDHSCRVRRAWPRSAGSQSSVGC